MTPERFAEVERVWQVVLDAPPDRRAALLDEACAGDGDLRAQVEMLISKDAQAGSFLQTPILGSPAIGAGSHSSLTVGRQYGHYRITSLLGAGGMGEVYRAVDLRLGRDVAIKTISAEFADDPARLARLRCEARTLASLNHPNIAAIYDLEQSADANYLVLELVEGETLRGPLPLPTALAYASQVAAALQAAHEHGIVHRDLKPANLRVTSDGVVKVLDFGLAKTLWTAESRLAAASPTERDAGISATGHLLGTPGYMSPEQARGGPVDQRTDIWAFGCLLYELLAGKRAFAGGTASELMAAVVEREPDWRALPPETPSRFRGLLGHCLEKDATRRLDAIAGARTIIQNAQRALNRRRRFAHVLRPRVALSLAALVLILGFAGAHLYQRNLRSRWVRQEAVPEIARLMSTGELRAAFDLMRRAEAALPGDPALERIRRDHFVPTSFTTNPPGAEVWATTYAPDDGDWIRLGTTPLTTRQLPWGFYRVRIVKPGYRTVPGTAEVYGGNVLSFDLDPERSIPPEMVRVPAGIASIYGLDPVRVGTFLIDRDEVTNREFKRFVEAGGYRNREYWREDFVRDGRTLSWDEAIVSFADSTGTPQPSTWQRGEYPRGRGDYPVNGVSWYEAAAYAEFAGKRLPTIYQWQRAASPGWFAEITEFSNFARSGPAPVGSYKGSGAFGTRDMAGNVKEWCWNQTDGQRYIRGGAWDEPAYLFSELDARSAWDRSARNGFRCMRGSQEDTRLRAPLNKVGRDANRSEPVRDEVFRVYRALYEYDPIALDPASEGGEPNAAWTREKVSFAAVYSDERIVAHLYLPKNATPPYQAILYANPGMALRLASQEPAEEHLFEFVVKSGRAVLHPVLKGYYQRRYTAPPAGPNALRDRLIAESKDFRRCIDYLASRPDIDRDRLGVVGYSRGAGFLPVLAVGERRLKAAALVSVGLPLGARLVPEADPINFVSRFDVPTLMANGRSDFLVPLQTAQRPMFRLLAAPQEDKRLFLWEGSHGDIGPNHRLISREVLEWLDRYLGPVRRQP